MASCFYYLDIILIHLNRGRETCSDLGKNIFFLSSELQKMVFEVLGDNVSPVILNMLYNLAKIPGFSREYLKQNVSCAAACISFITINIYILCIWLEFVREPEAIRTSVSNW